MTLSDTDSFNQVSVMRARLISFYGGGGGGVAYICGGLYWGGGFNVFRGLRYTHECHAHKPCKNYAKTYKNLKIVLKSSHFRFSLLFVHSLYIFWLIAMIA